jgi:DNA-binding transcriptional ArsR family regulator
MDKDKILHILSERLQPEGLYFLVVLIRSDISIPKEKLGETVNEMYRANHNGADLVKTRFALDTWTSRLHGAALVDIREVGRVRLYSISELGKELLEYNKRKSKGEVK